MRRLSQVLLWVAVWAVSAPALAALSVQGFFFSDGITGRPQSQRHNWDREIVYVMPVGTQGTGGGFRILATEPGWFMIQPPTGLPAGRYVLFAMNLGNIDGGTVGFDYSPEFTAPGSPVRIENMQFKSREHYVAMYNRNFTEWAQEPWLWGSEFYQTFIATTPYVTRAATKLADKSGGPGTHHLSMTLDFSIHKTNAGPPSTWERISPIRGRFLGGNVDPIIHIHDVNFLSHEAPLVVGQEYALRLGIRPGSECNSMAVVARPDGGTGYAQGRAYVNGTATNWDLYAYVSGGAPGTVNNFGPTDQDRPSTGVLLGWRNVQGQTFRATGTGLAGVELMYSVGCNPNPSLPVTITLYNGFGGAKIGTSKTCYSVTDLCQGRVAAFWEEGEAPLTPGNMYYIEFDATAGGGINVWSMPDNMPDSTAYVGGVAMNGIDLSMQIVEYKAMITNTPDPNATATPTNTATATPTNTLTPVAQPNLLANGNMEQGLPGTAGHAPTFWSKWVGSGQPTYWFNEECGRSGKGARLIGGAFNGRVFDAGYLQVVSNLTPGRTYALTGFVRTTPGRSAQYMSWMGIDLTGQNTDGLAATVQYTEAGGPGVFEAPPLIVFTATGSSATVFLRARTTSTTDTFMADFDDMHLYEYSGAPANTPTPTATTSPQPGGSLISSY